MPYSADVFPAITKMTFMGGAEKLSDGWNFPESVFPFATHLRPSHIPGSPRPRQIPPPMVVYVAMAVSPFLTAVSNRANTGPRSTSF